jgi:hypothetical protein
MTSGMRNVIHPVDRRASAKAPPGSGRLIASVKTRRATSSVDAQSS